MPKNILNDHWISYQELLTIISKENLEKITNNVYCNCKNSKMINFENNIYVNDLYDVILEWSCSSCWNTVRRYIETWENDEIVKKLKLILLSGNL